MLIHQVKLISLFSTISQPKSELPCWIPTLCHASNMRLFLLTRSVRHWLSNRGHWGWLWIEVQSPNYSFIDLLGIICKFKAGNALHESIHINSSAGSHDPWSLKILSRYFWGRMFQHQQPVSRKVFRLGYFEIQVSLTLCYETRPIEVNHIFQISFTEHKNTMDKCEVKW